MLSELAKSKAWAESSVPVNIDEKSTLFKEERSIPVKDDGSMPKLERSTLLSVLQSKLLLEGVFPALKFEFEFEVEFEKC